MEVLCVLSVSAISTTNRALTNALWLIEKRVDLVQNRQRKKRTSIAKTTIAQLALNFLWQVADRLGRRRIT